MEFVQIDFDDEEEREIFFNKYDKMIAEPYEHIRNIPGKNIRDKLGDLSNFWFNISTDEKQIIHDIIFKLHNLSLLIDDIQDNSFLRRAVPAAHIIYGSARTFTSTNHAMKFIGKTELPDHLRRPIQNLILTASTRALKGQIMDTYWRDNFICPTEEEYIDMICKKSGSIFQLSILLAMELSGQKNKDFNTLSNIIATHFQILDDFCNLKSPVYFEQKGFCEDITEGKFSYPVICALNNYPEDRRIVEILKMHTTDETIKKECLELIENYGGFEATKSKLSRLRAEMCEELDKLEGQPVKDQFLKLLFIQYNNESLVA